MKISRIRMTALAVASLPLFVPVAHATNGMDLEGYGPIALGMGGASFAYDNGMAAMMNNPATLGLMPQGNQIGFVLHYLGPNVSAHAGPATADSGGKAYYMAMNARCIPAQLPDQGCIFMLWVVGDWTGLVP
jgi:long-chain fatty acid transport protein